VVGVGEDVYRLANLRIRQAHATRIAWLLRSSHAAYSEPLEILFTTICEVLEAFGREGNQLKTHGVVSLAGLTSELSRAA
jgi:hypothetical protein